ncbi:ABC transporter ATP-binding protein [Kamptonema cortianum]|nr:ABC transporter ATP-binding protein [Kamptonema cortianum]
MLQLRGIARDFEGTPLLEDISLEVAQGEILCLLGASGSGKSTLLRIIAGLERADRGDVLLDGVSISHLPVHARRFGLMFQDFALFPHLNVADNIAFGLRMQHMPPREIEQRVREMLELINLSGFAARDVTSLSGGERQRVALARSLAPRPRLLMLDEPLGSLDANLRDTLAREVRSVIRSIGQTAVYVTHDQQEAFSVADRIALLHDGRIEQIDSPDSLFHQPVSRFAAEFLGLENIYPASSEAVAATLEAVGVPLPANRGEWVLIHPNGIQTAQTDGLPAVIQEVKFRGMTHDITAILPAGMAVKFILPGGYGRALQPGSGVRLNIDPACIVWLKKTDP